MKKEDKKYYSLPDGTIREIPEGAPSIDKNDYPSAITYGMAIELFGKIVKDQPAIYTDEKFPVGVVEGEIEVKWQWFNPAKGWMGTPFSENTIKRSSFKTRLFATRKREEVKEAEKYYFRRINETWFEILHKESGEHIANAPNAEKAHFITTAINQFQP